MRVGQTKLERLAIVFTVLWFFGALAITLSYVLVWRLPTDPVSHESIRALATKFQEQHEAIDQFDYGSTLGAKQKYFASRDLLDPLTAYPQAYRFDRQHLRSLQIQEQECLRGEKDRKTSGVNAHPALKDPALAKYSAWVSYLCSSAPILPPEFLEREPHTFPLGGSWAQRIWQSGRVPQNFSAGPPSEFLHALELKLWKLNNLSFPSALLNISADELRDFLAGSYLVVGNDRVFLRGSDDFFRAYKRPDWNAFLRQNRLELRHDSVEPCDLLENNRCWSRTQRPSVRLYFGVLLSTILLLLLWVAFLAWRRWKEIQSHRQERDLMLQTLAHELRHPAASLQLSLESFRREFDQLPDSSKDEFLRMTDQVQRLSRVIHASKNFLQSSNAGQGFRFQFEAIESVFHFLENCLESYREKIQLTTKGEDGPAHVDPYWTSLCVTNLVKNALIHGKQPIHVAVECTGGRIGVTVTDAGETTLSLEEMLQPFRKRDASPGMGLGLSLVHRVAKLLAGDLTFSPNPTKFILTLPQYGRDT